MSNELFHSYASGSTLYATVLNATGEVWYPSGEAFEAFGTGSRTANDYAIALTDSSSDLYYGDFPEDAAAGTYKYIVYLQAGASPADDDTILKTATQIIWTGAAEAAAAIDETTATAGCNRALLEIGGGVIDSIYDGSDDANICLIVWPQCRNEVLSEWEWQGTRGYADLGTEVTGEEMADWEYVFNLPSDCLRVVAQIDEASQKTEYKYEVRRGLLFTNEYSNSDGDSAYIKYIIKEGNTAYYSPKLLEAIAMKVGAVLARALKKDDKTQARMDKMAADALNTARGVNQIEQYQSSEDVWKGADNSWRNSR